MSRKFAFILTLIILQTGMLTVSKAFYVGAQTVGVQTGQWIKYTISVTSSVATVQAWVKATIQGVSGTTVSGIFETSIGGGAPTSSSFSMDIDTAAGSSFPLLLLPFVIPANPQSGQTIPGTSMTIVDVTDRTCVNATRRVVYGTGTITTGITGTGVTGTAYWDQVTGVFVEAYGSESNVTNSYVWEFKATETNMWTPPSPPGLLGIEWWIWGIVIVIVVCVAVAVAFILRRRRKPSVTPQAQPPPPPSAPPPELRVSADPKEILADGKSTSKITIELVDVKGAPLPAVEATKVSLYTTEGAIADSVTITKNDYSTSATLTSSEKVGTVIITAKSEGLKDVNSFVSFTEKPRYCMHCGAKMPFKDKRCSKCLKAPPAGLDTKVCKNCNTVIPVVARFCSECGASQPE